MGSEAQPLPDISLDPAIECWYHSDFPTLTALMDPSEEVVNSRLYFRCSLYPDYYFVDLKNEGGVHTAVAPQAEESCPEVHYYVEAVTRDFTSARTPERIADVTSHTECRRRHPGAAFYPSENPEIVLGSTVAGPQLAPGFKGVGISAFISAGGTIAAVSSAGGGTSAATIAGIAAVGAGAAGVGVLVANQGSDTTTTTPVAVAPPPPPPATTTVPAAPPPPAPDVRACVRFTPIDAIIDEGDVLTIDARCSEGGDGLSYRFDLGDGRVKEGQPFVTVVYPDPGTYQLTLTVTRDTPSALRAQRVEEDSITRTVRVRSVAPELVADFTVTPISIDGCGAVFDASNSEGDIVDYQWVLDVHNDFDHGVYTTTGMVVQHFWSYCFVQPVPGQMTTRLTVVDAFGNSDTLEKVVNVLPSRTPLEAPSLPSSLQSELSAADGATAQITLGEARTEPVRGDVPSVHRYAGRPGKNVLDAVLTSPIEEAAMWRFDFAGSEHFVPGSLRLVEGTEVSRDARSIVVRVSGRQGERVRLEYELR